MADAPPIASPDGEGGSAQVVSNPMNGEKPQGSPPASGDGPKESALVIPGSSRVIPLLDHLITAKPSYGNAVFSTDLGRRPKRAAPKPRGPVIAIGCNKFQAVAEFAHRLFDKYPQQYMCFFTTSSHTVEDMFDDYDISLHTRPFLEEVVTFITRENYHRAQSDAIVWADLHPERAGMVLTVPYEPKDPLAIVDRIFVDGEEKQLPRIFLWHVANLMRYGLLRLSKEGQAEWVALIPAAEAETAKTEGSGTGAADTEAEGSDANKSDPKTNPPAEHKGKGNTVEDENQISPGSTPGYGHGSRTDTEAVYDGRLLAGLTTMSAWPSSSTPAPMGPSATPDQPFIQPVETQPPTQPLSNGHQTRAPEVALGDPGHMPPPIQNPPPPRNPKNKNRRQNSGGSYNQQLRHQVWGENLPMPPPGFHSRNVSGNMQVMQPMQPTQAMQHTPPMQHMQPMQPMQPARFPVPAPMIPAHMGPSNTMEILRYAPNAGFMPTSIHPSQVTYAPMGHGLAQPQPIYSVAPPLDQSQQIHLAGGAGPNGVHMEDMTNNAQYLLNGSMQRVDHDANMSRRSSRADRQQMLYNPYADRPDHVHNVPLQNGNRRGPRNSFSNPQGRGRRSSTGPHNRASYGSYAGDQGDYAAMQPASRQRGFSQATYPHYVQNVPFDDPEWGYGDDWIGAKNETVKELKVFTFPPATTIEDVQVFFEQHAGVQPTAVRIRPDKNLNPFADVFFASAADARKGLLLNHSAHLLGKPVAVKVSTPRSSPPNQGALVSRRFSSTQPAAIIPIAGPDMPRPAYSPQDARSDLQPPTQVSEGSATMGSPGTRKSKKSKSPSKKTKSSVETAPEPKQTTTAAASEAAPKVAPESEPKRTKSTFGSAPTDTVGAIAPKSSPKKMKASLGDSKETTSATSEVAPKAAPESSSKKAKEKPTKGGEPKKPKETALKKNTAVHDRTESVVQFAKVKEDKHTAKDIAHHANNIKSVAIADQVVSPVAIDALADPPKPKEQFAVSSVAEAPLPATISNLLARAVKESSPEQDPTREKHENIDKAGRGSPVCDEVVPGYGHKKDTSFHSAKETQSDIGTIETKESLDPAHDASLPKMPGADSAADVGQENDPRGATESKDLKGKSAALPTGPDNEVTTPTKKKAGAKQTESIFPFAKSKTQLKKERQARKKDKQKAKAEKAGPSAKSGGPVSVMAKGDSSDGETMAHEETSDLSNPDRGNEEMAVKKAQDAKHNEGSPVDARKQNAPKSPVLSGGAQSYERREQDEAETVAAEGLADPPVVMKMPQEKQEKDQTQPVKVAVPTLKLVPKESSTSSKVPASGSNTNTVNMPEGGVTTTEAKVHTVDICEEPTEIVEGELQKEPTSMASSAIIQATNPPQLSPSPTAADFHTPLQTPTDLPPPLTEQPKKSKNRKRKKKAQAAAQDSAADAPESEGVPFSEQLRQIDRIRASEGSGSMSYHSVLGGLGAAEGGKTSGESQEKKARSAATDIKEYLNEKKKTYDPLYQRIIEKELRRNIDPTAASTLSPRNIPPQFSFEELEEVLGQSKNSNLFNSK